MKSVLANLFMFCKRKAMVLCLLTLLTAGVAQGQRLTPENIQLVLNAHNAYRTELRIPGLTWSDTLAQYAQRWVNELVNMRDCAMEHRPHDDSSPWNLVYGENIYSGGGTNWIPTIVEAVAAWGKEKNDFNFNRKECKDGKICGHYTQIIWKNTTQVGCASAVCADGNVIIVCNYNPSGNWSGEKPY